MRQPCKRAPQATPPISELELRLISSRVSVRYRPRGISPSPTRLTSNPLGLARNGEREVQNQKEMRKRDQNGPIHRTTSSFLTATSTGNDRVFGVTVTRRLRGVGRRGWAIRVSSAGGGLREMTRGDLALREKGLILWQRGWRRQVWMLGVYKQGHVSRGRKRSIFEAKAWEPTSLSNHKIYLHQS